MLYKNISTTVKTFYGITFQPGEVKDVPGRINHKSFVVVKSVPKEPPKRTVKKKAEEEVEPSPVDPITDSTKEDE